MAGTPKKDLKRKPEVEAISARRYTRLKTINPMKISSPPSSLPKSQEPSLLSPPQVLSSSTFSSSPTPPNYPLYAQVSIATNLLSLSLRAFNLNLTPEHNSPKPPTQTSPNPSPYTFHHPLKINLLYLLDKFLTPLSHLSLLLGNPPFLGKYPHHWSQPLTEAYLKPIPTFQISLSHSPINSLPKS